MIRSALRVALPLVSIVLAPAAGGAQQASDTARTLTFTGFLLVNGFWNDNTVNNADVPQFVVPDTAIRTGGIGGTARQSQLGLTLTQAGVLGGVFTGQLEVDFFGGQLGDAGRTFPLLRLRRLVARINWPHGEWLVGQEAPLVAALSPRSLAGVGTPGFAGAGNLWFWMPQLRGTYELGRTFRVALQGAVIAPMTGDAQGLFDTQPDLAEKSGRPFLQGRLRIGWGATDDPSEIGVGVHQGWFAVTDSTLETSRAVVVGGRVKFGFAELRGEWYDGHGLAALGGGGIARNFSPVTGFALDDRGGWAQMNILPRPAWEFGGGCGIDEPDQAQLDATSATERLRNFVCEGHVLWFPAEPIVVGVEFRRLETKYGGATETLINNHLNLQAGFRF